MSNKRESPAQKAARISGRREAAELAKVEAAEQPTARPVPRQTAGIEPVSAKPVRITLDLAPSLYDSFGEWNRQAARQIGVGRITGADTLRILLRRLLADEQLAADVLDDLRHQQ